jgi:predicted transcriptional regulator
MWPTRLETFLKERRIKPAHLARESGYSRQHLLRIRMGRMEPTRRCIAAIVAACRELAGEKVLANDLFELEPLEPEET